MESAEEIRNESKGNIQTASQLSAGGVVTELPMEKGEERMDIDATTADYYETKCKDKINQLDLTNHSECSDASIDGSAGLENISVVKDNERKDGIRIKMLARVAVSDAHFKHQQRGDPDLTLQDKIEIAQTVLDSNKVSFLAKFGNYLELEDLEYFFDARTSYEIDFYCKQIEKSKSKNFSETRVKNRRYQALKELISQSEYFSDEEMKFRDPYLYHQMVGQYLTDDEIQASIDKSDLRFSSILVKHIDQLNENERFYMDKDKEEGQEEEEEEEDSDENELEDTIDKNLENKPADDSKEPKISDQHKQELRAEFLSIMQERFLHGEDKNFNYSQVDSNEEYDDLNVLSHDAEEKYFDEEDPESVHSDSNP